MRRAYFQSNERAWQAFDMAFNSFGLVQIARNHNKE